MPRDRVGGRARKMRHARVRKKVSGTSARPRLCVFRSLNHIYAQVVDDERNVTLASASSKDKGVRGSAAGKNKTAVSSDVGALIASRARERGLTAVVFDRGGYRYHGRIRALAEAARKEGLVF